MSGLQFSAEEKLPCLLSSSEDESCYLCLVMIAKYYGQNIDQYTAREYYGIGTLPKTVEDGIKAADSMRLTARVVQLSYESVDYITLPAIAQLKQGHYVVLKEISPGNVHIHDPKYGIKKIDKKEFMSKSLDVGIELTPTQSFKEKIERRLKIHHLWDRAIGLKRGIIQIFVLSFILELFALGMPFLTQLIVDDVLVNLDRDLLMTLGIAFTILVFISNATTMLRSYVVMHFGNRMGFQLSLNIYRHLLRLPVDFFSKRHMGDIMSRYNSTGLIKDFLTSSLAAAFVDGILVIGTFSLMLFYSPLLTGIALVSIAVYMLIRFSMYNSFHARTHEKLIAEADEHTNFMENINAIQGIKIFGKESDRIGLWQRYFARSINASIRLQKLNIVNDLFNGTLRGLEYVAIAVFGAALVLDGVLSIGMLIAFLAFKDNLLMKSFALIDTAIKFRMLRVELTRLSDIAFAKEEKNMYKKGVQSRINSESNILDVENVGYRYQEDDEYVIKNINLHVGHEETVAIVGASGCGKSTLLKVLTSLYSPAYGSVRFNSVRIEELGLEYYRSRIGAVLQNDSLLSGSIAENISFFDPEMDMHKVKEAAALANIADEINKKPSGYETFIDNLGASLSGGQVQRILLARALYRSPELVFLDEATSALDLENERAVNRSINALKIAKVIVAHRPETIKQADRALELRPDGLVEISIDDFINREVT